MPAIVTSTVTVEPATQLKVDDVVGWTDELIAKYRDLQGSHDDKYLQNGNNLEPPPPALNINKNRLGNIWLIAILDAETMNAMVEEYSPAVVTDHDGVNRNRLADWAVAGFPVMTHDPPTDGPNKLVIGANKIITWTVNVIDTPVWDTINLVWEFTEIPGPISNWQASAKFMFNNPDLIPDDVSFTAEGDHEVIQRDGADIVQGAVIFFDAGFTYLFVPTIGVPTDPNTTSPPVHTELDYTRYPIFDKLDPDYNG